VGFEERAGIEKRPPALDELGDRTLHRTPRFQARRPGSWQTPCSLQGGCKPPDYPRGPKN
jgi:hypothetical protein